MEQLSLDLGITNIDDAMTDRQTDQPQTLAVDGIAVTLESEDSEE